MRYCSLAQQGSRGEDGDENDPDAGIEAATTSRSLTDKKGRTLYKRKEGKTAVPRWRFLLPHGEDQEKYYEQVLLLKVPFTRDTIGTIISPENETGTYLSRDDQS